MPELPIPPTLCTGLLSCVPARELQVRARALPLIVILCMCCYLLAYWPIYAFFVPPLPFLLPSLPSSPLTPFLPPHSLTPFLPPRSLTPFLPPHSLTPFLPSLTPFLPPSLPHSLPPSLTPSLPRSHVHMTSCSGLYQNPNSRVCEECDEQCVGGCTGGTVRSPWKQS